MTAKSGDRILMLGKIKRANPNERAGVIESVLSDDPPRYVIRWDSGRETVLAPLPGAIRVEPTAKKPAAKKPAAKKPAAKKPAAKKPAAKAAPKASTAAKRKTAKA